jgi:hypothetical protein
MAIAPMEKRSGTVWNRSSALTAATGGVFALIALFFLWAAFKNYMVKSNYVKAAAKYDANRRAEVKALAEKAKGWGRHAESAELLAKVLVESNQLDAAEKLYTGMLSGSRRAYGLCGLGLIQLRRAEAEKDPKKGADFARKAKDRFTEAKGADSKLVEAQIGGATADLLSGLLMNEPTRLNAARIEFNKIHKALKGSEDLASNVTREGYMDLFVGLARSWASPAKFAPEALTFAGSARRYQPGALNLQAMELALQAQQMAEMPPTKEEIKASRMQERMKTLRDRIYSSLAAKGMDDVSDAWFSLVLSTAAALSRAQDTEASNAMLTLADSSKGDQALRADILEAALRMEAVRREERNWGRRQSNYSLAKSKLAEVNSNKSLEVPAKAALRAALLNNEAYLHEDQGAQAGGPGGEPHYKKAVDLLLKALEAEKAAGLPNGSYEVQRNLAVIQLRRGKADDAAAAFDAAQKAAVDRTESSIQSDLEDLRKYFAEKK